MSRFPWIIYIGSGVLAFTAAKMITDEPFVHNLLFVSPIAKWAFVIVVIVAVLLLGLRKNRMQSTPSPAGQ
jgi:predicted tellurium resistance membrane protein TerC